MHRTLLKEEFRPIVHLRDQVEKRRFGLILGAGTVRDFNVPMWSKLIENIAADRSINGTKILEGEGKDRTLPYKTQMLYQRFRKRVLEKLDPNTSDMWRDGVVKAKWSELCARHIYANAPSDLGKALSAHKYFSALLPLIQKSPLTVTFNFDDFLERSLALNKKPNDKISRGYEVVTDPWPQFRRADSVIYHPHGIVPAQARLMELPVDRFVFSEAAYSAQYVGSRGHDSSFLLAHFARNTCLIIGSALEEELRNVLMRGAQINPGNYHYYVHFINDDTSGPTDEEKWLMSETNFNVYNLITLFLTREKIRALLELLDADTIGGDLFHDMAEQANVPLKYNFYLTGAIGVGKSTTANQLRNLHVLDEWLEVRPQVLAKRWSDLTQTERDEADRWIVGQFAAKNNSLRHLKAGISIIDRPPLDPLSFTKKQKWATKATALLDAVCPDRKLKFEPGTVILFIGDPEIMEARVRATGRETYTRKDLNNMQETLKGLYEDKSLRIIDTRNLSIQEVTKEVAEIVHRAPYKTFDVHGALLRFANV